MSFKPFICVHVSVHISACLCTYSVRTRCSCDLVCVCKIVVSLWFKKTSFICVHVCVRIVCVRGVMLGSYDPVGVRAKHNRCFFHSGSWFLPELNDEWLLTCGHVLPPVLVLFPPLAAFDCLLGLSSKLFSWAASRSSRIRYCVQQQISIVWVTCTCKHILVTALKQKKKVKKKKKRKEEERKGWVLLW